MPVADLIPRLADPGCELTPALVSRLSGLLPDEHRELAERWTEIPPARRLMIVRAAAGMADENVALDFTDILRSALADEDPAARAAAASGLWETSDRAVIGPLTEMLERDASPEARAAAASALAHFAETAEAGGLIDRDADLLRSALLAALENDEEEFEVRCAALEAAAPMRRHEVAERIRWAHGSGDARLRKSAVRAMGRSSDAAWLPLVAAEFSSPLPEMRLQAAAAAGDLADPAALLGLRELADDDDDPDVAAAAVRAVASIGGAAARKLLKRWAERGDPPVNDVAQEALRADADEEGAWAALER